MRTAHNLMSELERWDSFLDGSEPGDIPLEVLRKRGIELVARVQAERVGSRTVEPVFRTSRVEYLRITSGVRDQGS